MPTQITTLAVSKSFNGVLDSVTCSPAAGERTGIVGENGSGKTTFLRLLTGRERPDRGEVVVPADGGVGYLAQDERPEPQATVQQIIGRALSDLLAVEQRMRRRDGRGHRVGHGRVRRTDKSPALVEELEAALADYGGALVIVSHDRRVRWRWQGAHLAMQPTPASAANA